MFYTSFQTITGNKRIPINIAVAPGIDDYLIAAEEQRTADREERIAQEEKEREIAEHQRKAKVDSPDVCRCPGDGQCCHLIMHQRGRLNAKQTVTRSSIHCASC